MQEKIIILREKNHKTKTEIARLLGITAKQYKNKESGKARFYADELYKIAEFFKVKPDDIFLPTTHQNGEKRSKNETNK